MAKQALTVTALPVDDSKIEASTREEPAQDQTYLTGLRGIIVIQSFLWVYFSTFIPDVVLPGGPAYQAVIRDVLSILWNESLIYNGFILLAMRTVAISYLNNPSGQSYAAAVFRRIIKLVIIMSAASGMATLIYSQIGTDFVQDFITALPASITAPVKGNGLTAVNAIFDLFWLTRGFYTQAANRFWPTHTLWTPAIIYYQSWTVYFLMVFLPYTRPAWHIQGLALFALGSFWFQSWGWYSATGLFFADLAVNKTINSAFQRGIKIADWQVPYWIPALLLGGSGIALKYVFTILPQYSNSELILHPYLSLSESHSVNSVTEPYPRFDDWLIVVAVFIAVESLDTAKSVLSSRPLVVLGKRSFSIFTGQCLIFWTVGIKLWLHLISTGMTTAVANTLVLITCLFATATFAEVFYRLVDLPATWSAQATYKWLIN